MRIRWSICLLLLSCFCVGAATPRPQVQVTAKRRTDSDGRGSGYYDLYKTKEQKQVLDITVRNLDRAPRECQVQWYFTARPAAGGERFIYDQGSSAHAMSATGATNLTATSTTLRSEKSQFYGDGRVRRSGSEVEGYFVLVGVDGQVVATTASTRPLQQAVSNPKTLQQLLDTANNAEP